MCETCRTMERGRVVWNPRLGMPVEIRDVPGETLIEPPRPKRPSYKPPSYEERILDHAGHRVRIEKLEKVAEKARALVAPGTSFKTWAMYDSLRQALRELDE
jgi:hypothetical protein